VFKFSSFLTRFKRGGGGASVSHAATSALDNRTQATVTASLKRLKATRILVAHRLSTLRSADRIYVIEKGRVVQQGSYDDLVKEKGLFARLVSRQKI
jgi:ABC-type bacteriocin/lantibiotic exporter with double-glycine peptidase domain